MAVRDVVRTRAGNRGWTYVVSGPNGLVDTYSRPVKGWKPTIQPNGDPAWDEIANWKPQEMVWVTYDAAGNPVNVMYLTPDEGQIGQGRWVGTLDTATGSAAQKVTKVNAWLDKQAL